MSAPLRLLAPGKLVLARTTHYATLQTICPLGWKTSRSSGPQWAVPLLSVSHCSSIPRDPDDEGICLRAFAFLDMHCCNPRPIESAIRCMATQVVCTRQRGQFAGLGNPGGEPLTILWDSHDGSTSAASVPPTYMAISVAAYAVRPA